MFWLKNIICSASGHLLTFGPHYWLVQLWLHIGQVAILFYLNMKARPKRQPIPGFPAIINAIRGNRLIIGLFCARNLITAKSVNRWWTLINRKPRTVRIESYHLLLAERRRAGSMLTFDRHYWLASTTEGYVIMDWSSGAAGSGLNCNVKYLRNGKMLGC